MTFHSFDPWQFMMDLQTNLVQHQQNINEICIAHNRNQQQTNEIMQAIERQGREIRQLQAELKQLRLNTQSEDNK